MAEPDERGPGDDSTVTWRELIAQTAAVIGDRVHARWLCEVASAADDADDLAARLDEPATVRMVSHLDAMVGRYRAGEPLQYVLGEWGFRRLTLAVDARVLIPRPETELVAEVAIAKAAAEKVKVGDPQADVSPDALDVARANLAGTGPAGVNVRIGQGSWFDAVPDDVRFDVIVANPPYVAEGSPEVDDAVADWEPTTALYAGRDGLDDIRVLIAEAPEHLVPGGWLILEIGADQGAVAVALMRGRGYADVELRRDLAGRDRIVLGRTGDA